MGTLIETLLYINRTNKYMGKMLKKQMTNLNGLMRIKWKAEKAPKEQCPEIRTKAMKQMFVIVFLQSADPVAGVHQLTIVHRGIETHQ